MSITELKQKTAVKERFATNRHKETMKVMERKFKLAIDMMAKKDKYAKDRHKERLELLG